MPRALPDILRITWPPAAAAPPAATDAALDRAAGILVDGGLVAIPTETVYGLAANALDEQAVAGIYRAKGRPAGNPLIVHVDDTEMARTLAADWPVAAATLADHFWPGPLTLVVPRGRRIPSIVSGGGETVGLRCPDHRLARRLIAKAGVPLAAPSANRSEAVSPTTAQHVLAGLGNRIDLILDGGSCARGIESTVVDCTTSPPRVLRPGPLSPGELSSIVPGIILAGQDRDGPARSPGQAARHYAPSTPLELTDDPCGRVATLLAGGSRVGWLAIETDDPRVRELATSRDLVIVPMPADPQAYAARLYATLHALDQRPIDRIVVDCPPDLEAWQAIRDRLVRAGC